MGYYTTPSLWPSGSCMGSEMGPLSSQGSSWYRAIVSLGLSLTIFVLLWLVTVRQTDRIGITKGGTRTKPCNWSVTSNRSGSPFSVMIPVTLCHFSRPYDDYTSSYYYTFQKSFFNFYQTSQVVTLGGPYHTDPFWATLTYFSRSQNHFSAEITKLKIVITFSFLARFWSNFTGVDPRSTPSLWPSFVDLDLLLQVKLDIGSKYCVVATAKTRQRRIIFSTGNYSHY